MTSTAGCELMNLLNPDLRWKTVTKRCRSNGRRRPSSKNMSIVQYDTTPKEIELNATSDTEKNSVDVLGRHFKDNLDHVPIKKRRLQAFSSYLHKSTPSIPKRQRKASGSKIASFMCEDFSGIEILAAVACGDEFAKKWLNQQESVPSLTEKMESVEDVEDKKIPIWDLNEPPSDEQCPFVVLTAPPEKRKMIGTEETDAKVSSVIDEARQIIEECGEALNRDESEKNTASHSLLTTHLEEEGKFSKAPSPVHDGSEELLQKSSVDSSTTHSEANLAKAIAEEGDNSESNIYEADKISEMFYDSSQFEDGELRDYDNERRFVEELRNPKPRIDSIGEKPRVFSKESLQKPRSREDNISKKFSSSMGFWDSKRPIRHDGPPKPKYEGERLPSKALDDNIQRRTIPRNEYHHYKPLPEDFERHRFNNRRSFYFYRCRSPPYDDFRQRIPFPKRVPEYNDDVSPPRARYHEERKYVQRFPRVTPEGPMRSALKGTGEYDGRYRFESERQYDYKRFGSGRVGWRFDSVREPYKPSGKKVREVGSSRGEDYGRRYVKRYDDDFGVRRFVSESHERRNGGGRYDMGD